MLGGVGAVFSVLGVISTVSSAFLYSNPASASGTNVMFALVTSAVGFSSFVGFILFLVAMYGFSKDYAEHRIFGYLVSGIIWTIVGAVVAGVIFVVALLLNLATIIPNLNPSTTDPSQATASMVNFLTPFTAVFLFVGLIWIVFNVKALKLLGEKSGVPLFKTGTLVLLAAALVNVGVGVVFAVLAYSGLIGYSTYLLAALPGGIVQDGAWVILAMAFFRIKPPETQAFAPSYASGFSGQVKYCSHCGTPNQLDAVYCTWCGQKL
jgi:uncharacterized membrane protein